MHWGVELANCPTAEDRALAQKMLDAGASAVVGAHPHVLQGQSTSTPGKLIAYSMGNFVFYARRDAARRTGVLTVSFSPEGTVTGQTFDPALIDSQGRPIPLAGPAADQARAAYDRLRIGGPSCP
jgi:poly-gamma-glutamate synthesis protein (capsule biosynthesis protein)